MFGNYDILNQTEAFSDQKFHCRRLNGGIYDPDSRKKEQQIFEALGFGMFVRFGLLCTSNFENE